MSGYHHGNLRVGLIDAGVDLARDKGPDGVVLRAVARRTGVSHNAAYRHFADRDALLAEIAAVAMRRLGEAMQREIDAAEAATDGPPAAVADARLRALGRAYVEFAVAEQGLFEVAFSCDPTEASPGALDPFSLLSVVLDEGVVAGSVDAGRRPGAEVVCWAAVHGFATLHVRGPLAETPTEERLATLEVMLDHVARGLL